MAHFWTLLHRPKQCFWPIKTRVFGPPWVIPGSPFGLPFGPLFETTIFNGPKVDTFPMTLHGALIIKTMVLTNPMMVMFLYQKSLKNVTFCDDTFWIFLIKTGKSVRFVFITIFVVLESIPELVINTTLRTCRYGDPRKRLLFDSTDPRFSCVSMAYVAV